MKRFNLKSGESASHINAAGKIPFIVILFMLEFTISLGADARGHSSFRSSRSFSYGYSHSYNRGFHSGFGINRVRFYNYGYYPRWGYYYDVIPAYELQFLLNGATYYYGNGIYYRNENGKYVVTEAPIGYRTKVLPKNCLQFTLDNITYFYDFGTFYSQRNGQYEVVRAPLGAVIDILPDGADKVLIEGQTFYSLNGVQYKAVIRNNEIWYEVIKN